MSTTDVPDPAPADPPPSDPPSSDAPGPPPEAAAPVASGEQGEPPKATEPGSDPVSEIPETETETEIDYSGLSLRAKTDELDASRLKEDDLASVLEFAQENKLSAEQASAVLSQREAKADSDHAAWEGHVRGWRDTLVETYGDGLDEADAIAVSALQEFGPEGFVEMLNDTGYGKEPSFFAFAHKVGLALKEPDHIEHGRLPRAGPATEAEEWAHSYPHSGPLPSAARNALTT